MQSPFPSLDLVVERQWHIGIHARALEGWAPYRVLGGFPSRRYQKNGIPPDRLVCHPWPALYNWVRSRLHSALIPPWSEPKSLAAWVKKRRDLAPFVVCYATAYRWLFPSLANHGQVLVIERGSCHPAEIAEKVGLGFREAGLRPPAALSDFSEEVKAGLQAHFVVAGSQMIFDSYARRGHPTERLLKIPYGIATENFPFFPRPQRPGPVRIATVGILGVRKGLARLARISDWAHKRAIPLEFHLVGPEEPEARQIRNRSQAVWVCHGVKKGAELNAILHACDLYALPSYEEGFGLSVLESMATGLAAIISTATGAREAVTDGVDGLVLESFSDDELDLRLRPILNQHEKRRRMGFEAARKIREHYAFENYCARLRGEYMRMFDLAKKASGGLPRFEASVVS